MAYVKHDSSKDTIAFFLVEVFECIAICLPEISQETQRKIYSKCSSYLAGIQKSKFLISLLVCEKLLSLTVGLFVILQEKSMDLIMATKNVENVVLKLEKIRKDATENFQKIFPRN